MPAPKNPKGAKSDKEWRKAIMLAVNEVRAGKKGAEKALRLLARKLVDKALDGDVAAMREIGDRLDGKATLPVSGPDDGPLVVQIVRFADKENRIMVSATGGRNRPNSALSWPCTRRG